MGLALLWALLLGVPGAPDPWSDDVGLPGYDLSFIPWNDEEPQFRERAVKVYHLSPDLGRLDGGLLVNVTGKGFIAQAATDPKCQFGAPENCVDESCIRPRRADGGVRRGHAQRQRLAGDAQLRQLHVLRLLGERSIYS